MKIWIIKIGEPLEYDYDNVRLLRSSILAKGLLDKSHTVYFFVDKFDHFRKKFRNEDPYTSSNINYIFLNGISYKKNFSIKRFINHFQVAINFYFEANRHSNKPEIVLISFPTIFLAFSASFFCKKNNIPYVIDLRDAWPTIFSKNRFLKLLLHYYYKPFLNYIFKNSLHITGCAPFFENFYKLYTNQKKPFTYIPHTFPVNSDTDFNKCVNCANYIVYFGAISRQRRLDDFLSTFSKIDVSMNFYICGDGDQLDHLKAIYKQSNIIWLGQVDKQTMAELALNSLFGIAPYELHEGYQDNIPNKIVEYLSYGLPVITNINNSITAQLNKNEKIIFQYQNDTELLNILTLNKVSNNLKIKIKNIYEENFSERRFIEKFEKIIESIK